MKHDISEVHRLTHSLLRRYTTTKPVSRTVILLAVVLSFVSCRRHDTSSETHASGKAWFEEVAVRSGIDFRFESGHKEHFWFPEIMGGGIGLLDYDNDGFLDVYFVQGGSITRELTGVPGNRLYHNRGGGTFEDVTEQAGVGDTGFGMGCTCADYDGDGYTDIYVTNVGPNVLYHNTGDGTFENVTSKAGVGDASWGSSSAFVDFDGDGNLDLYVTQYISWSRESERDCFSPSALPDYCHPNSYSSPVRDTLYRNLGDGTFADATKAAGIDAATGNGLGVTYGDFNGDGRMDFYVANDSMMNQLWLNQGAGRFSDEALVSGCALNQYGAAEAGMGVATIDLENDGDLDLFMSHLRGETNTFYRNRQGVFEDGTVGMGLAGPSKSYTGFGLGFADFDHDTVLDLYVANGRVALHGPQLSPVDPYAEPNLLFRGNSQNGFEEVMPQGGTTDPLITTSRAAAFGDLDNDGDVDIVVVNKDARAYLLRNVAAARGQSVLFRVLNRRSSDAIGARVRIKTGEKTQWRMVAPGYSYCASNDPRVHFGLGSAVQVDRVTVYWPNGQEESFGPYAAGKNYLLREGSAKK